MQTVRTETSFVDGAHRLVGDIDVPSSDAPLSELASFDGTTRTVVVFVEGSGPGGREQGQWSKRLHASGLATFAYDKPGCGASTGDWTTQSIERRADETVAAVQHVSRFGFDRVVLVGFSQGGWVARLAATRSDEIGAVVTVSGPAVDVATQEHFRLRTHLPSDGVGPDDVRGAIELFERRRELIAAGANGREIWDAEVEQRTAPWYRHSAGVTPDEIDFVARIVRHDPLPPIRQMRQPLLSVFGGSDVLVDVDESVEVLATERPDRPGDRIMVLPGLDHSLREYTGTGSPVTSGGHFEPGALAPGVVESIASWIDERMADRRRT